MTSLADYLLYQIISVCNSVGPIIQLFVISVRMKSMISQCIVLVKYWFPLLLDLLEPFLIFNQLRI